MLRRWKGQKFRPSDFLIKVGIWSLVAAVSAFGLGQMLGGETGTALSSVTHSVFGGFLFVLCVLLVIDLFAVSTQSKISCERVVVGSVSVNKWFDVQVRVHHNYVRSKLMVLFDDVDANIDFQNLPINVECVLGRYSQATYKLKARERGVVFLRGYDVSGPSPLNFWRREYKCVCESEIKVFPDFSAIAAYTILATDNHLSQLGIKRRPRRGQGLEFNQLRDYRLGDSLRQVDWNATSRRNKLISREYQDERDQQLVFLVDSGRRMRAQDDALNHFDHALHATLMVSYIALRQGDSCGVMSFGGDDDRWLAPQKGPANMKVLLNGLFDLHTSNSAPDYVTAAEKLVSVQKKRSLIVIVTNTRDEDVDEVVMAVKLLRKKHLVLVANIRERAVEDMLEVPVTYLKDALNYVSATHYLTSRTDAQQKILSRGVFSIDCFAEELPARISNSYLEIKRSGVL